MPQGFLQLGTTLKGMGKYLELKCVSKVFLKFSPNGPSECPNVFLIATCLGTLKLVDYPTLLGEGVLVLGGHQQVMDGANAHEIFTEFITFHIWQHIFLNVM